MPFIGNQPAEKYSAFQKQDFTTSATTSYTLDHPVANQNEIALFINFVRQEPTTAYTASGTSLTLTSATSSSDDMYCIYLGKAVQTVNPPSGSVGLAQLSATGTKDSTTFLRGDNTFASAGGTNTPAFLSTMSALQTPSSATATLVNFDQTTYDTASGYNTSSKKYVIPSAGYYHLYTCVNLYNSNNDLDRIILYLYINAAIRFQTDSQPLNAASDFVYLGGVYNCSANDEITVQVYQVSGSGTGTVANDKSFFGGYKLIS